MSNIYKTLFLCFQILSLNLTKPNQDSSSDKGQYLSILGPISTTIFILFKWRYTDAHDYHRHRLLRRRRKSSSISSRRSNLEPEVVGSNPTRSMFYYEGTTALNQACFH